MKDEREFVQVSRQAGGLVSPALAANVLGVSPQRVRHLMDRERLHVETFRGWVLLRMDELQAYARTRRSRAGRAKSSVPSRSALAVIN